LAQLIRIAKWWVRQEKRRNGDFKCKSFMVELIWVHLADAGVALNDYPSALEEFFAYICKTGLRDQVSFTDFCSATNIPVRGGAAVEVLDPVNPENNIASRYSESDRLVLVQAAQDAYDAVTTARFATTKTEAVECWQDVLGVSFKGAA
jgi:hypothetical protein